MNTIKRIVAMIAMLAVLLSSLAFAEEAIVEPAQPAAAESVAELPAEEAEEPAAELSEPAADAAVVLEAPASDSQPEAEALPLEAEPAAEEAEPVVEEAAPAAEGVMLAASTTAEHTHIVVCVERNKCMICGEAVTNAEIYHPENAEGVLPTPMPGNASKHGYVCPFCQEMIRPEPHYVSCVATNLKVCSGCGASVNLQPEHKNCSIDKVPVTDDPTSHGYHCNDCGEFIELERHYVACDAADTSKCAVCYTAIDSSYIQHNLVNNKCTRCGYSLGIEEVYGPDELTIGVGESFNFAAVAGAKPETSVESVSFKVKNTAVAKISASGMLTGVKKGSTVVTITAVGLDGVSKEMDVAVSVKTAPKKISLSKSSLSLLLGESYQLVPNIGGSSYASSFTWESSDPAVAYADEDGLVHTISAGSTKLRVSTFNGKTATCTVNVYPAPTAIEVPYSSINMYYKQSLNLDAKLVDDFGVEAYGSLKYSSDHPANVSVSSTGKLTVKKSAQGTAIITITGPNDLEETVEVNVRPAPTSLSLEETSIELDRGDTYEIEPIVPEDTATVFKFSSSNKTVASVDAQGVLTAVSGGKATITVKTHNGKSAKLSVTVNDPNAPESVELNQSGTVYLPLGGELQLEATLYPETAETELTWKSTKTTYAKIDEDGLVTGVKVGTSTVGVITHNGKQDTITVKVVNPNKVAAVTLDQSGTVYLAVGDTLELNAAIQPYTAEANTTWSSSAKTVASVEDGVVEALKVGSAKITVKAGGKTDSVTVKVVDPSVADSVVLDRSGTVTINIGEELQLNAEIKPETAENEIAWSSSKSSIATVDDSGLVTPLKAGTATITVKTDNGKKDSVKVKVVDKHKPSSIQLPTPPAVVNVGEPFELVPSIEPADAMTYLIWKSSDESVATVEDGIVTFHKKGSVSIGVKTHNGKTDIVSFNVEDPYTPTSISISGNSSIEIAVDELHMAYSRMTPSTAVSTLTWSSSNSAVATVDANGLITGVAAGKVTITVKTHNGKQASISVTVSSGKDPYAGSVDLSGMDSITALEGKLGKLEKKQSVEGDQNLFYYADASGNDTVVINRAFADDFRTDGSIVCIEIQRYSDYSLFGVTVGMKHDAAVATLKAKGVDIFIDSDGLVSGFSDGKFKMIELIIGSDGRVASVSAFA